MINDVKRLIKMEGFFKVSLLILIIGVGVGAVAKGGSIKVQGVEINFGNSQVKTSGYSDKNGALFWIDNISFDKNKSSAFYENVFGWKQTEIDKSFNILSDDTSLVRGGTYQLDGKYKNTVTPYWRIYIAVDDIKKSLVLAKNNGAIISVPLFETNTGKIAILTDPVGASFAMIEPK